jgi:hypothetical protein
MAQACRRIAAESEAPWTVTTMVQKARHFLTAAHDAPAETSEREHPIHSVNSPESSRRRPRT